MPKGKRKEPLRRYRLVAKHRASKGLHHGSGRRAYGHTRDYRQLVIPEAEILFLAAKEVDQGKAIHAIVERWTQAGVPTLDGNGRWHQKVLRDSHIPRMVGKREYEGALIDIEYMPAILPEELWRRVRKRLLENSPKRGPGESRELTNIALCGICSLPLIAQVDRAGPSLHLQEASISTWGVWRHRYSRVQARREGGRGVVAFLNDKQRAIALLDQHKLDTPEMAAIDARYAQEDDKLALERAAFRPPQGVKRLPTERYFELRTEIDREQETLQRRRYVNRDAHPLREAVGQEWTVEDWRSRALEWRRAVIGLVVERIEVARKVGHGARGEGTPWCRPQSRSDQGQAGWLARRVGPCARVRRPPEPSAGRWPTYLKCLPQAGLRSSARQREQDLPTGLAP